MKDTFKDAVIDEMTHDEDLYNFSVIHKPCSIEESLNQVSTLPRSVIKLEKFYDLKEKFKDVRNCKTNSSTMQSEVINLGSEHSPQCVNLGSTCTPHEKIAFIRLFNEFKDIFSWTYDDLKTFDPNIMQHVIPMKQQAKPIISSLRMEMGSYFHGFYYRIVDDLETT